MTEEEDDHTLRLKRKLKTYISITEKNIYVILNAQLK